MAGNANRNVSDDAAANAGDEDDTTAPAIPKEILAEFLAALTGAITTAVVTRVSVVRSVPTPRYSTSINAFDTKSMELTSRDGRGQWYKTTDKTGGWKEISLVTENADIFTDILTYRTTPFGLDPIMNVSTSGTGGVNGAPLHH